MTDKDPDNPIGENIFKKIRAGEVSALSYAISAVENHDRAGMAIFNMIGNTGGRTAVIGFTGPPGVGKSTLINAYITFLRKARQRVAVVAIDPSSPMSGGAILGDRFRMGTHANDPGVFIRSVSSRGRRGGLCAAIFGIVDLIDAAGWDVILLETVGAGQADTEVADIADIKIVIQAPGLGDDMQAIKAGILEIADVLVVNKADLPHADETLRQLYAMLRLKGSDARAVPLVKTVASEGTGIEQLHRAIVSCRENWAGVDRKTRYDTRLQRFFARDFGQMIEQALARMDPVAFAAIYKKYALGEVNIGTALELLLEGLHASWELKSPHPALRPSGENESRGPIPG